MFNSSQDILFFVIAVAVVVLTVLVSWLLVYIIRIVRKAYGSVELVSEKIETLARIVDTLKEKIEHSTAAFSVLAQAITKVVDFWGKKRRGRKTDNEENEDF